MLFFGGTVIKIMYEYDNTLFYIGEEKDFKLLELIILLIFSILSSAYYIRLIRFLFFTEKKLLKISYLNNYNIDNEDILLFILLLIFILNILIIFFHVTIYSYIFNLIAYLI